LRELHGDPPEGHDGSVAPFTAPRVSYRASDVRSIHHAHGTTIQPMSAKSASDRLSGGGGENGPVAQINVLTTTNDQKASAPFHPRSRRAPRKMATPAIQIRPSTTNVPAIDCHRPRP